MAKFNLREFAEFEAIAIAAGEYGAAAESAKTVGRYEKLKIEEQKKRKMKRL